MIAQLASLFRDSDPSIPIVYFGSIVAIAAVGYWLGARAALRSGSSTARGVIAGVLAGAGASLIHPVNLFVEISSLADAGAWAAIEAVVAFGVVGVIASAPVAAVHALWCRGRAWRGTRAS